MGGYCLINFLPVFFHVCLEEIHPIVENLTSLSAPKVFHPRQ